MAKEPVQMKSHAAAPAAAPAPAPAATPPAIPRNFTMEKWSGGSINVDGWVTPEQGKMLKGILVGNIPQERSPKLKSDQLLFELIEAFECKSADDTDVTVTCKPGQVVGIAQYKSLEGLFPQMLGHVVYLTMTGERPIPGQSPMKLFDTQTSTKPVRAIAKPDMHANGAGPVPFEV